MIATKIVSESKRAEIQRLATRLSESHMTICGWPSGDIQEHGEPGNNPPAFPFMKTVVGEG